MNTTKAHIAAIAMLDRAFALVTDEELAALIAGLPEDHSTAVGHIAGIRDDATPTDLVPAVRIAAQKGRINGDLERLAVLLTDACLADCIEQLGDHAELPSEEDLEGVLPGIVERHGLPTTRVMLASVVAGDAPAGPAILHLLKHDDVVALPPAPDRPIAPLLPPKADDAGRLAIKAARKERKSEMQAAARARREQSARDRHG